MLRMLACRRDSEGGPQTLKLKAAIERLISGALTANTGLNAAEAKPNQMEHEFESVAWCEMSFRGVGGIRLGGVESA